MNLQQPYTVQIYQQRVLIIGLTPPPQGGISVHIARAQTQLQRQQNQVQVLDVVRRRQTGLWCYGSYLLTLTRLLWSWRPQQVHYHVLALWWFPVDLLILGVFRLFQGFKLLNIEHVGRYVQQRGWWYKRLISGLFRLVDQQVLMGWPNYYYYLQAGWLTQSSLPAQCPGLPHQQLVDSALTALALHPAPLLTHASVGVGPALNAQANTPLIASPFLPPDLTQEAQLLAQYPASLQQFLAQHAPVLLINASRISFWRGVDVYGLDQALQLLVHLQLPDSTGTAPLAQPVGLILMIANLDQPVYLQQLVQQALAQLKLTCHQPQCHWHQPGSTPRLSSGPVCQLPLFLLTGAYELWPLLKRVQLFLRPTSTDNCAVSEAEAAYFGTPTVASDVCPRLANTALFKARDQTDLNQQVQRVLAKSLGSSKLQQVASKV